MGASIVLIGASNTGKTTLAKLLAEALNLPMIDVDDLRWSYGAEIGYDPAHADELLRQGGILARYPYWKPFEIHAVERVLQDYPADHVIAFGAGNSVYDDPAQLERAKAALAPFPHVIWLQYTLDVDETAKVIHQRFVELEPDILPEILDAVDTLNRHFLTHPSNSVLATMTIYTAGKSPAESCAEILQKIQP